MNCIKCYQEIPEGSKFCPHCGAQQPDIADAGHADTQTNTTAQPDAAVQPDTAAQQDSQSQNQNTQYQDPYAQYQDAQNYGVGSQNTYTSDYQNNQYQYQTPPVYQSSYEPEKPINWVPYLVLSIITTICCCLPFGIVGIVYSTKINSAMSAGNYEEAQRSARTAKIWIIVAAVVGVIANIIMAVMMYMGFMDYSYYYYY